MITLYTETMKRAATDECETDNEREIVDGQFEMYLATCEDYLAKALGGNDQVDPRPVDSGARCCDATNKAERDAWNEMPGFWEWWN